MSNIVECADLEDIEKNLNISTLVYMLNTNIKIDPNNLENIFDYIEPIPYFIAKK